MTTLSPPPPPPPPPPPAGFPPAPPLEPPPEARSASFGGTRPPTRARPKERPPHLLAAEVTLFGLTAAGVYGFTRIFEGTGFLWPLLALAAVLHVGAGALRRRGVGLLLSFVALAVVWVLTTTWLFFLDSTWALLPTGRTLELAGTELERAWTAFRELVAPAPELTGFVLAAAIAVGVTVFLADWAAFRMWSSREAVVPSLTLFVFATMLAGDRQRIASAIAYFGAALVFVLVHRVARLERSTGWVSAERALGGRSLLRVGVALGVVAVVVGAAVGPRLPGADEAAIVDWRGGAADTGRVTISPLVDIRSRLVERTDTPVFTVRAEEPAYWRMTALDDFDGNIWRSRGDFDPAGGALDTQLPAAALSSADQLDQEFTIQALSTIWLPAAYLPFDIESSSAPVALDRDSTTLIVRDEDRTSDGIRYQVSSLLSRLTPDDLAEADPSVPEALADMVELPTDFPESVRALAAELTAGATSRYDAAMRLQSFFRDNFTYDLTVESGHDGGAIEQFLEQRRGYCEQFAGTFAAMARSLGIPARVAVGFTWGDEVADDPGLFQVRGRNAHAWPEVWMGEYGWVAFEPTPGRGAPGAEPYTGVGADQEDELPDGAGEDAPATTAPPEDDAGEAPTTAPPTTSSPGEGDGELSTGQAPGTARGSGADLRVWSVTLLTFAVLAYLALVPGTRALAHARRRRAAAGDPRAEVGLAWAEATDRLAVGGIEARRDETHAELAARAASALPDQATPLHRLADAADVAAYAPEAVGPDTAAQAGADARAVAAAVDGRLPWWRRALAWLDPRTVRTRHAAPRHLVDRPHG